MVDTKQILCKIQMRTKLDGVTQLSDFDDIAPNMGLASQLFQNAEFRINDRVISRIGSNMPQIDALDQRLSKSKSWIDSHVGNSTNFWEDSFAIRQFIITSDGVIDGVSDEITTFSFEDFGVPANAIFIYEAGLGSFNIKAVDGEKASEIPDLTKIPGQSKNC